MILLDVLRSIITCLLTIILLTGCAALSPPGSDTPLQSPSASPTKTAEASACPVIEPEWVKPPEDAAVSNPPAHGYYYVNQDRSMWASAWWVESEYPLRVSAEGLKVGWFRPAGATLEITGQRMDGAAPVLEAHVPCCYPTRFQATGLYFPTPGCWQVNARATESELSFIVWIEP